MFDDMYFTHLSSTIFSYYDKKKKTPVAKLISLKLTPGKDTANNAAMASFKSIEIEMCRHGGTKASKAVMAAGARVPGRGPVNVRSTWAMKCINHFSCGGY